MTTDLLTREEFYRAIEDIKAEIVRNRDANHELRTFLQAHAIKVAMLGQDVDLLKAHAHEYRGWVANVLSAVLGGGFTAGVDWWLHR